MKNILVALSLVLFLPVAALAQGKTAKVGIKGMHCASCLKSVSAELKKLPDVADVKMDLKKGVATVMFNEGATPSVDAIKGAVKEAGFEAKKIEGI